MDYLIHIYCKVKSPLADTVIQDARSLAVTILTSLFPNSWEEINLVSGERKIVYPYEEGEKEAFVRMKLALALILSGTFEPIFKRLFPSTATLYRPTLESVFEMCDSIDRYQELMSIYQRACDKVNKITPRLVKSKFSLKYYSLALRAVSFKKE
jgi:uncharacterized membrane protein YukC